MRHFSRLLSVLVCAIAFCASPALHALTWVEVAQLTHAGGAAHDEFGWSVAVDGDVAVVGDPKGFFNGVERAGVAHVFVHSGGTWTEAAELLPSDSAAGDAFGGSVAIRGDTIAVGSPTIDIGAHDGIVYVFVRPGGGWSGTLNESARLDASGSGERFQLGGAIAFAGDSIVSVSAVATNVLFVFNKPVSGWSGTVAPSAFAYCILNGGYLSSVAGSGDVIVAGSPADNLGSLQQAGKAFVWVTPAGGWSGFVSNAAELLPSDPIDLGQFGQAVGVDGTTALVTNRYPNTDFPATPNKSKGYIFERPLTGWAGTLTENARLVGSDVTNGMGFGWAASISGGTAVIAAASYGSAYIFDEPPFGWSGTISETATLVGPQAGTNFGDDFGFSVAISANVIVVGAPAEDVSGNVEQGAAHVYELRHLFFTLTRFLVKGPVRVAPGVPVEFSFRVEALPGAPGAPSGEVVVSDGVGQACRAGLSSSGEAVCALTFPSAGLYQVRAAYEGGADFAASTSPPLIVFVGRAGGGP